MKLKILFAVLTLPVLTDALRRHIGKPGVATAWCCHVIFVNKINSCCVCNAIFKMLLCDIIVKQVEETIMITSKPSDNITCT